MKIAICFSGQPRALTRNLLSWQNNVINPLNADVFCHFWEKGPQEYVDHDKGWSKEVESGWIFNYEAVAALKAKSLLIEAQKDFRGKLKGRPSHCGEQNTLSMMYSIQRSNQLKMAYERENGFRYDVVIRARTDSTISSLLVLSDVKPWSAYVEYRSGSGDQFAYGPSRAMDIFCSVFDDFEELIKINPFHSESWHRIQLERNGIANNPTISPPLMRHE